jgi:hypothetical protein
MDMPRLKMSFTVGPALASLLLTSLLATVALTAAPRAAHAEQFVLFDAKFTFTKADADNGVPNKSHYYITSSNPNANFNPARPTNWIAPIDYRNGIVHIRTEVIEKPAGSEITQWFLCYIANRGVPGMGGYGCVGTGTYKEQGVYEREESMTTWWNNTAVDWTQGIKQVDMVMKDFGTGNGGNYTHLRPDPEHFFPTRLRVTVIQVSKGATYDPSLVPGLPASPADAGPGDAADAGAGADVAMESTPGMGGTGGASGSGGVAGSGGTGGASATGGNSGTGGGSPGGSGGAGGKAISPGAPTSNPTGCAIAANPDAPGGHSGGRELALALLVALTRRRARRA